MNEEFDIRNAQIDLELLRTKKLIIATPMYGGQCSGVFTKAISDLAAAAGQWGLKVGFYFLFNESLITRARNYCADEFLRSDATHMLFIDSDIGFNFKDVLVLWQLACRDEMEIVCGPYPKKTIAWEKVIKAVDKGYGKDNPFELENFVGDYVFNPAGGITSFKIASPLKVLEAGTGFMMISREALEKYAAAYPEFQYKPDHVRTEHFDGTRMITAFFDTVIDPATKRYLSEDYMFCQHAQKAGIDVWMCPWMQLRHVGSYTFGGSLAALSSIDAALTSDQTSNKKNYSKSKKKRS